MASNRRDSGRVLVGNKRSITRFVAATTSSSCSWKDWVASRGEGHMREKPYSVLGEIIVILWEGQRGLTPMCHRHFG